MLSSSSVTFMRSVMGTMSLTIMSLTGTKFSGDVLSAAPEDLLIPHSHL